MHRNQFPGHQMPSADPSNWHFRKYMCGHWSLGINRLPPIAAAAKAIAATVEEIGSVIAAGGWVALVIVAVIINILVIIMAVAGYLETMPIGN